MLLLPGTRKNKLYNPKLEESDASASIKNTTDDNQLQLLVVVNSVKFHILSKTIDIIARLRHFVPSSRLLMLYSSLISQ